MCTSQIISNNGLGCVVNCCNRIHLGFGVLVLVFNRETFHAFCHYISLQYDTHYAEMLLTGNKLFLQIANEKIVIALATDELKSLYTLVSEAAIMLEVGQLLKTIH